MSNFFLPISTIAFSCFFLIFSLSLPKATEGIGPGGWPTVILTLMLVLGVVLFIRVYKEEKKKKALAAEFPQPCGAEQVKGEASTELAHPYRHWLVAGIIFAYLFIIQYVGMMLTTPFFIIAMGKTLGLRGWVKLTIIALLFTTFIIGLFGIVLTLSLPQGVGIFRTFSSLFY